MTFDKPRTFNAPSPAATWRLVYVKRLEGDTAAINPLKLILTRIYTQLL